MTLLAKLSAAYQPSTGALPQELKQVMAENGGRFENYYCRAVTHIVCTNLPDSKVKHHAHERDPPPTVRPEWVVDSLAAGRLLPVLPLPRFPACHLVLLANSCRPVGWQIFLLNVSVESGHKIVSLRLALSPPKRNSVQGIPLRAGKGVCAVAAARQAGPAHAERLCGTAAVALRARAGGRPSAPVSVEPCGRQSAARP